MDHCLPEVVDSVIVSSVTNQMIKQEDRGVNSNQIMKNEQLEPDNYDNEKSDVGRGFLPAT